ncbi:MAG: BtrH N-terminal domain-containing protein [Clostridia bacterium]|nr:BtrH N-terminal domain-containing protein [Clostridia bacterium]
MEKLNSNVNNPNHEDIEADIEIVSEARKFKVIDGFVENTDNYTWDETNCFFKSIAIDYESFSSGYFDLFMFYSTFYYTFRAEGCYEDSIGIGMGKFYNSFLDFHNRIMEDRFGMVFKTVEFETEDEMHEKIKIEVDNEARVLVPGDVMGLYYNMMYREVPHDHYFIIKGYNTEKKIYYIMDNMHIDNGGSVKYKDFMVKFSDLYEMRELHLKNFTPDATKPFFWSVSKTRNARKSSYSVYETLLDHAEYFKKVNTGEAELKYLEQEAMKKIELAGEVNLFRIIVRIINSKSVYYGLLFKFLENANIDKALIEDLKEFKKELEMSWFDVRRKLLFKVSRNNNDFSSLKGPIESSIEKERIFRNKVIESVGSSKLQELVRQRQEAEADNEFIEKNNSGALIVKDKNRIQITHSSEKKYETWTIEDNAPQMLIYNTGEDFMLETKMTLNNRGAFHSGVIIKLANGMKLLYGVCIDNKFVIFCPERGDKYSLIEENFQNLSGSNSVYMRVQKEKGLYTFYNKLDGTDDYRKFYTIKCEEKTVHFGFFSKTWEAIEHKVEFEDIKYSIDG